MPVIAEVGGTPRYVLMNEKRRIGPQVMPRLSGVDYTAIYGFSHKSAYDNFCGNTQLALIPYPLVEGYLQNQADVPGDELKLVVIDASGPHEPCLHATTIEAVLEAQANRTNRVTAEYRLLLDQGADAYRMEEESL